MSTKDYFVFAIQLVVLLLGCFCTGYFLLENWQNWFSAFLFKDDKILLNQCADFIKLTVVLLYIQFFLFMLAFKTLSIRSDRTDYDNNDCDSLSKLIIFTSITILFIYFALIYGVYAQFLHTKLILLLRLYSASTLIVGALLAVLLLLCIWYRMCTRRTFYCATIIIYLVCSFIFISIATAWILTPFSNLILTIQSPFVRIRNVHIEAAVIFTYIVLIVCCCDTNLKTWQRGNSLLLVLFFALALGLQLGFKTSCIIINLCYDNMLFLLLVLIICNCILSIIYVSIDALLHNTEYDTERYHKILLYTIALLMIAVTTIILGMFITMLWLKFGLY